MINNRGVLYGSKVYTIGNLQAESYEFAKGWRDEFKRAMDLMGVITMSPLDEVFVNFKFESKGFRELMYECLEKGDHDTVHKEFQSIRRRDLAMVDHSQFIVGILNPAIPTFGTIEELSFATRANKPIFLVIHGGRKRVPLWVQGMVKPECIYEKLDYVIGDLHKINAGLTPISNEKWRIFKHEYLSPPEPQRYSDATEMFQNR